jgi:hypothetical protein
MNESGKPRHKYSVNIPPNATPEEIKAFMKEFMKKMGKRANAKTQPEETDPDSGQASDLVVE